MEDSALYLLLCLFIHGGIYSISRDPFFHSFLIPCRSSCSSLAKFKFHRGQFELDIQYNAALGKIGWQKRINYVKACVRQKVVSIDDSAPSITSLCPLIAESNIFLHVAST